MNNAQAVKNKKCKHCRQSFKPFSTLAKACSPKCALALVEKEKEKQFNKETRRLKAKVKTKAEWLREAQQAFNSFVRIRDHNEPCISCRRYHSGQYHAGHYRTVKAAPQLRFNLKNCHKQCMPCNAHLSGNITEYRINLVEKIGPQQVESIESNNESKPYNIEYAKRVKRIFNKRARLYKKLFRDSY